jgi:hypothetical protein
VNQGVQGRQWTENPQWVQRLAQLLKGGTLIQVFGGGNWLPRSAWRPLTTLPLKDRLWAEPPDFTKLCSWVWRD